jgi:adenylate cyclase
MANTGVHPDDQPVESRTRLAAHGGVGATLRDQTCRLKSALACQGRRMVRSRGYAWGVAVEADGSGSGQNREQIRWSCRSPPPQLAVSPARNTHYAERIARQRRVVNILTWLAAAISAIFAVSLLGTHRGPIYMVIVNAVIAVVFATIPLLHRFGLIASLTLILTTFVSLSIVSWNIGTGAGLDLFFVLVAAAAVLVLGIEHIALASILVGIGAALVITLQFTVPPDTGVQPRWWVALGFITSVICACGVSVAAVWYALREIERAENAMELEYQRSESLLANILPPSIASRLKNRSTSVIADRYADASVLFADIAGYTEWASETAPAQLVQFLNRLYTDLDRLVDDHGLEKIKTSGDCYIVVSGVPERREDHLQELARLALSMAEAVAGLTDPRGRRVRLRIGLGVGPVVAGVVGTRKFFYDVWGDAVNVASRMESTGVEGKIQVPQVVHSRLKDDFVFEERGEVIVKGKGVMRTWFLIGKRDRQRGEALGTSPASGSSGAEAM